ncbi:MAG: TraR/DksA family transcriptional regulator [Ferruginibacter sp.]
MATKKQPVKKAVKPAAKKVAAKPAPKKAAAKPVAKKVVVKAAPKKAAAKPVVKKVAPKPTPKKVVAKPAAKKAVAKPVAKVPAKKFATPVKAKVVAKPVAKAPVKKVVEVKQTPLKKVPETPVIKPMAKKEETKKPVEKVTEPKVVAKPAAAVKAKDIKVPAPKPVVIPKITTKTVRKYQPDFTKSVLDKAKTDPGAPSMRYSDSELAEFKDLILRKLEAAKKELTYLHGLITRKDDMGGDETDNRYMTMEDGSLSMEREQLSQMASRQITFIDHLEKAIMRIENKTYGICRVTGKLIDKARLRAVPHATLSIEAKMSNNK